MKYELNYKILDSFTVKDLLKQSWTHSSGGDTVQSIM